MTLAQLAEHGGVGSALSATIEQIATPQIRSTATVAGNLCQAKRCWFYRNGFDCYKRGGVTRPCYAVMGDHRFYHAVEDGHRCQAVTPSDLATTLIALDAELVVEQVDGQRRLAVADLYTGPGEVGLAPEELITRLLIPARSRGRETVYRKLSLWHGAFAMVTVAVSAERDSDGALHDVHVVLGGVAPTPRRAHRIEQILEGRQITEALLEEAAQAWLRGTHPLADNHWKAFAAADEMKAAVRELLGAGGR